MNLKFKSRITRFGSILTPHILEIDDNYFIYKKRNMYLLPKIIITAIEEISNVEMKVLPLGTDVTITTIGGDKIVVKNLNKSDAETIIDVFKMLKNTKR